MSDLQKIGIAIIIVCISLFCSYKYGTFVERKKWEQEQMIIKNDWISKYNAQIFSNKIIVNNYENKINELEKAKSEENVKYVEEYIKNDSDCNLSGDIIELHNKLVQ